MIVTTIMRKFTLLLFILFLLFVSGCSAPKKPVGSSCSSAEECSNYNCVNGICAHSEEGEFCGDSSVCNRNLICKDYKCSKPPTLCEFKEYSSIFKTVGIIMLLLLIAGIIWPLPTAAFSASITHGGTNVVGYILIMAIALAVGFYLSGNCF